MSTDLKDQMRDLLAHLTPEQMEDLEQDFQLALLKAKREEVPEYERGTPKDPAVQLAAGWAFKFWRSPDFRHQVARSLPDEPLSYEEIGTRLVKVSRERVRQLYADLCPLEYEAEKQDRRTPVRHLG
jgi:hypothetical protein